ncbi:uncharacterized protein LOC119679569 [Teleopsis dalmanni]|uniref:uncharacterized protein LOC119679569 n=1 Tax=Teleopsis dalmanni TaxID=139649 RepID=UPI0018CCF356|nr:uncharacterized protein LOC119679569 [Teleopsis dalmanni]
MAESLDTFQRIMFYVYAEERIANLENQIANLKEIVVRQNEIIVRELADIKALVNRDQDSKPFLEIFPILNKKALNDFEKNIGSYDEATLISNVQKIISKGGFAKNLHSILGKEIITNYNYDGIQTKEAFKVYTHINNIFYKAVGSEVLTKENYINEIKKGFKVAKNRYYRETFFSKKTKKKLT